AKHQKKRTPVSKNPLNTPSCWCDGAWQESTKAGGMGWIIKNTKGEVICRGFSNRYFVISALMAEALAMREALGRLEIRSSKVSKYFRTPKSLFWPCAKGGI
ncbi:unnamed protein product, partial [Brassica oleracea]